MNDEDKLSMLLMSSNHIYPNPKKEKTMMHIINDETNELLCGANAEEHEAISDAVDFRYMPEHNFCIDCLKVFAEEMAQELAFWKKSEVDPEWVDDLSQSYDEYYIVSIVLHLQNQLNNIKADNPKNEETDMDKDTINITTATICGRTKSKCTTDTITVFSTRYRITTR